MRQGFFNSAGPRLTLRRGVACYSNSHVYFMKMKHLNYSGD